MNRTDKPVEVIVVDNCHYSVRDKSWSTAGGDELLRELFSNLELAIKVGKVAIGKGRIVIVRPTYNDPDGTSFREWRSFDGSSLDEVVFIFGLNITK